MKVEFQQNYQSLAFNAKRGDVIESDSRPPDQLKRWLDRGLVKPAAGNGKSSTQEDPKRTATTGGNKRKATT
jgi:hypothetical protein